MNGPWDLFFDPMDDLYWVHQSDVEWFVGDMGRNMERPVEFAEVQAGAFVECGMCGTAAVISPVGKVVNGDEEIVFASGMEEVGPVMRKLRETLTGIQAGEIEGPEGWVVEIC